MIAEEPEPIVIMGAGGHGRSVADALELQMPGRLIGFIDDDESLIGSNVVGFPVMGNQSWLWERAATQPVTVAIGLGSISARAEFYEKCESYGIHLTSVIHPTAIIAKSAYLGRGVVVFAQVKVNANAHIGRGAIVGTSVTIEHDVEVGHFTLIGPNVVTGGAVKIGDHSTIGLGSHLLPGVHVGRKSVIGAGAMVTRNVPDDVVAFGIPARFVRQVTCDRRDESFDDLSTKTARKERIYLSPPHMSGHEQELITDAIASNWVAPIGPHIDRFETEFASVIGLKHAVAVSSGTAAMHLAIRNLHLEPGDEVFCSTSTFAASVTPVIYERGIPVFIDSAPETWNIDCNLLEEELKRASKRGRLPRAVIAVDLYGQCADWNVLRELCDSYGIPLIEDAAESLGATYRGKPAGSFGWANIFSFNGNKIITTSGGGMLATNDSKLAAAAKHLATQARDPAPHYEHSVIGYNYRMSNVLAAIGRAQLNVLKDRVAARRAVFDFYQAKLRDEPGIEFMPEAPYGQSTRWLTCILIDPSIFGANCEDVRRHLETFNIESRPAWKPMHLQPVFSQYRTVGGRVAETFFRNGLCLPSGSSLTITEMNRVVSAVLSVPRKIGARKNGAFPSDTTLTVANLQ